MLLSCWDCTQIDQFKIFFTFSQPLKRTPEAEDKSLPKQIQAWETPN